MNGVVTIRAEIHSGSYAGPMTLGHFCFLHACFTLLPDSSGMVCSPVQTILCLGLANLNHDLRHLPQTKLTKDVYIVQSGEQLNTDAYSATRDPVRKLMFLDRRRANPVGLYCYQFRSCCSWPTLDTGIQDSLIAKLLLHSMYMQSSRCWWTRWLALSVGSRLLCAMRCSSLA